MNPEQKERFHQIQKTVFEILGIGFAYYLFIRITKLMIPCPIKLITGKYCPGCGISRMLLAFLRLDFEAAFLANRLLFFLVPLLLLTSSIKAIKYIKNGTRKQSTFETISILVLFIITVIFWILRNTEKFSFLAPME